MKIHSDLDYPLLPETLISMAENISKSSDAGQSISFVFEKDIGGERALLSFIYDNRESKDFHKFFKDKLVYKFDFSNLLEYSLVGFFYELNKILNPGETLLYEKSSIDFLQMKIRDSISKNVEAGIQTIIFIPKVDSIPNFDQLYGNQLMNVWRLDINKQKIVFVFSMEKHKYQNFINEKSGDLKSVLLQNLNFIDRFSEEDIRHSIEYWLKKLDFQIDQEKFRLIANLSEGSAYKSKLLTQHVVQFPKLEKNELELKLKELLMIRFEFSSSNAKLKIIDGNVFLENKKFEGITSTESDLLKLFINNEDTVVNREMIADLLWGKEKYEKYSDWAIDKHISIIRKKLEQNSLDAHIETIKGSGYKFSQ